MKKTNKTPNCLWTVKNLNVFLVGFGLKVGNCTMAEHRPFQMRNQSSRSEDCVIHSLKLHMDKQNLLCTNQASEEMKTKPEQKS